MRNRSRIYLKGFCRPLLAVGPMLALSACANLPSSGPTTHQILRSERDQIENSDFRVVDLSRLDQLPLTPTQSNSNWPVGIRRKEKLTIGAGDTLGIRIYEVGVSLFSSDQMRASSKQNSGAAAEDLPAVQVDENGNIFLPYAGKIHVASLTVAEAERKIDLKYAPYSQSPKAMVSINKDESNNVIVSGDVARPGRLRLTPAHERILDALVLAGGTSDRPEDIVVKLNRDNKIWTTRLREVYNKPAFNILLYPGDEVQFDHSPRTYVVFGAAGRVDQIPFKSGTLSLAEAIARAGGPSDNQADPTGVFLFRYNPDKSTDKRIIYRIDLMRPSSYFLAQKIQLKDKDLIYIANARSNQSIKFVQILNQLFSPILTVRALTK